jgi:hypothetical protein
MFQGNIVTRKGEKILNPKFKSQETASHWILMVVENLQDRPTDVRLISFLVLRNCYLGIALKLHSPMSQVNAACPHQTPLFGSKPWTD